MKLNDLLTPVKDLGAIVPTTKGLRVGTVFQELAHLKVITGFAVMRQDATDPTITPLTQRVVFVYIQDLTAPSCLQEIHCYNDDHPCPDYPAIDVDLFRPDEEALMIRKGTQVKWFPDFAVGDVVYVDYDGSPRSIKGFRVTYDVSAGRKMIANYHVLFERHPTASMSSASSALLVRDRWKRVTAERFNFLDDTGL